MKIIAFRLWSTLHDTEMHSRGVYGVMKFKPMIIGLCLLLGLMTVLAMLARDRNRQAAQAAASPVVVAPNRTIALPPNDHWRIVATLPKPATNAGTTTSPAGKK